MATTSTRQTKIVYTGDVEGTQLKNAAANAVSPGSIEIKTLASGANVITVPGGGSTPKAVTIVPPDGNTTNITLKGVTGDVGIQLHDTDHSVISLDSSVTSFVLTAAAQIIGVRLFWS